MRAEIGCLTDLGGAEGSDALPRRWRSAAIGFVLALATLAAYGSFADFEFVNWDDKHYVTENPLVLKPGFQSDNQPHGKAVVRT